MYYTPRSPTILVEELQIHLLLKRKNFWCSYRSTQRMGGVVCRFPSVSSVFQAQYKHAFNCFVSVGMLMYVSSKHARAWLLKSSSPFMHADRLQSVTTDPSN